MFFSAIFVKKTYWPSAAATWIPLSEKVYNNHRESPRATARGFFTFYGIISLNRQLSLEKALYLSIKIISIPGS